MLVQQELPSLRGKPQRQVSTGCFGMYFRCPNKGHAEDSKSLLSEQFFGKLRAGLISTLRNVMGLLAGKRFLIVGVASKLSIASGIAEAMHREGLNWRLPIRTKSSKIASPNLQPAGARMSLCFPCDVASDEGN